MKTIAIIVAGGEGERFGLRKQFTPILGKAMLAHTVAKFDGLLKIIPIPRDAFPLANEIAKKYNFKDYVFVIGGETRQRSVRKALRAIATHNLVLPDAIVITDANRPLIPSSCIAGGIKLLDTCDCVVSVCRPTNTMAMIDEEYRVLPRKNMYELLMPQFFQFDVIRKAHERTENYDATDDSQLLDPEKSVIKTLYISPWEGMKLTYASDRGIFEMLMKERGE